MLPIMRSVVLPLLSLLLVIFGAQFFGTFTNVHLHLNGLSDLWIGMLNASYYAGMLGISLISSPIISRLGHARSFACGAMAIVISILAMSASMAMPLWLLMRAVTGGAMAVLFIVIESWMLVVSGDEARGRVLSVYMFVLYCSQASSQYLMDLVPMESAQPFIWAALLCAIAAVPILFDRRPVKEKSCTYPLSASIKEIVFCSPLGFLGAFLSGILLSSIYAFYPKVALENQLSVAHIMAATIFGGVFFQWPFGYLSDKYCRQKTLIIASSLLPLPCLAFLIAGNESYSAAAAAFIFGGIAFGIYPQSIALMCKNARHSSMTAVCSIATLIYGMGAVLGPIFFGAVIHQLGVSALIAGQGSIGLVLASLGVFTLAIEAPAAES